MVLERNTRSWQIAESEFKEEKAKSTPKWGSQYQREVISFWSGSDSALKLEGFSLSWVGTGNWADVSCWYQMANFCHFSLSLYKNQVCDKLETTTLSSYNWHIKWDFFLPSSVSWFWPMVDLFLLLNYNFFQTF